MTIDYSSAQAIYDHVCRHIAVQGFRATNGLMCRYRGAGGASCAVGCLIPDKDYFGSMEGNSANNLYKIRLLPEYLWPHLDLLRELQSAHDNNGYWLSGAHMERRLATIASRFYLDPSILKRLDFGTIVPDRLD